MLFRFYLEFDIFKIVRGLSKWENLYCLDIAKREKWKQHERTVKTVRYFIYNLLFVSK